MSNRIISTNISINGKEFLVSTIARVTSAVHGGGMRYAETMVWELTKDRHLGKLLSTDEGPLNSITTHIKSVEKLWDSKKP